MPFHVAFQLSLISCEISAENDMFEPFLLIQPLFLHNSFLCSLFFLLFSSCDSASKFPICPLLNFHGVTWPRRPSSPSKTALVHPCRYVEDNINYHLNIDQHFFNFFFLFIHESLTTMLFSYSHFLLSSGHQVLHHGQVPHCHRRRQIPSTPPSCGLEEGLRDRQGNNKLHHN